MASYRVGIDIGGTFTDHIWYDEATGEISTLKVPTTPEDFSLCFLDGVQRMVREKGADKAAIPYIAHGTTVCTNAILERKGAKLGFINTRGYRDILQIGRQISPSQFDFTADRAVPLSPRYLRKEIDERIAPDRSIVEPLDEEQCRGVIRELREEGVDAIGVSLHFAFSNPIHEERVREIIHEEFPEVDISSFVALSSGVAAEFREFERASTVAVAAYLTPVFRSYAQKLQSGLAKQFSSPSGTLYIMQSSGGLVGVDTAIERAHTTTESGPAAGVLAAAEMGKLLKKGKIISFDMGGTSAKASLMENATPTLAFQFEVGTEVHSAFTMRASGYPIRAAIIDLVECSAGGGSIASVDSAGVLKVGPRSAGADPGPACYGRGGTEPTVTDAQVVLGRISPDNFLGGQMRLHEDLAAEAITNKVARPMGIDLVRAAEGILDVANAHMQGILKVVSVQRGFDPRDFTLIAFGGAGALHAVELAEELGLREVIIPLHPGLFSAQGLTEAELRNAFVRTKQIGVTEENVSTILTMSAELEQEANQWLDREHVEPARRVIERSLDMRYVGQNWELAVPLDSTLTEDGLDAAKKRFVQIHDQTFGHSSETDPVEIVNFRVYGASPSEKRQVLEIEQGGEDSSSAHAGSRMVFFKQGNGMTDCQVFRREGLTAGNVLHGPAIVEQMDCTIVVPPGSTGKVDKYGNLWITRS